MRLKLHYILLAIFATFIVISSYSCKKADSIIPDLQLFKDSVDTIILNEKLIDPGAMSVDNKDGNISSSVSSDYLTVINKDSVGKYVVTYKIIDKAGNINSKKRTVYVMNQAKIWEGNYSAVDTLFKLPIVLISDTFRKTYSVKIVASWKKNREFWIEGFGKFSASGYPSINMICNAIDSAGILKKANSPLVEIKDITFGAITNACATSSHRVKSVYDFYLLNSGTKTINIEYEDEIFAPTTCIALLRGRLKLVYTSAL